MELDNQFSREPEPPAVPAAEPVQVHPSKLIAVPDSPYMRVECPVCGGKHHVETKPLTQVIGFFNRYYLCPETGEPVPVSIAALHGEAVVVPNFVARSLLNGLLAGRYLTLVFRLEGDSGEIKLDRYKSEGFPVEVIPEAMDLAEADLAKLVPADNPTQIKRQRAAPANVMDLFKAKV